jgi:ketosteroid isomerase-like protein
MPSKDRVDAFVAAVREGRYVEAIEAFYEENATMRENLGPARAGRAALIEREKAVLGALERMSTQHVGPVLIDGDLVAINWVFEMTGRDGSVRRLDEIALQTWRGEHIADEQFYYDPGQLAATH